MQYTFQDNKYSREAIDKLIRGAAGEKYSRELTDIFCSGLENNLLPKYKAKQIVITALPDYLNKWVQHYFKGFELRPSKRKGNQSSTVPDSLLKEIYQLLHADLSEKEVLNVANGHSVMMTIENIIGDMLEEYLSIMLKPQGWLCCWGTTIKSVDFCKTDGTLLQIKTSDNSENSSSSAVRTGTSILKWARRKALKQDEYYWNDLIELTGNKKVSEKDFRNFVRKTIKANPNCIYIVNDKK
jgi:hypothetical protein